MTTLNSSIKNKTYDLPIGIPVAHNALGKPSFKNVLASTIAQTTRTPLLDQKEHDQIPVGSTSPSSLEEQCIHLLHQLNGLGDNPKPLARALDYIQSMKKIIYDFIRSGGNLSDAENLFSLLNASETTRKIKLLDQYCRGELLPSHNASIDDYLKTLKEIENAAKEPNNFNRTTTPKTNNPTPETFIIPALIRKFFSNFRLNLI